MKKVITDYLDETSNKYPRKTCILENKDNKISFHSFANESKRIACYINKYNLFNKPIAIFIDKSIDTLKAMFGVLYSGNFYTVFDTASPKNRLDLVYNTLKPTLIITNNKCIEKLKSYNFDAQIINIDLIDNKIDNKVIKGINQKMVSTNPAYVLFTSGSTGVPKGSVITHKSVIAYIKWFIECFSIDNTTIFGNQSPFYFSMSVSDIYSTMFTGATFCIIPKINFTFTMNLVKYLNEFKINTIYWVPSALSIVANLNTFDYAKPKYLKKVLFAGEVMPTPTLNKWRKHLPNVLYGNLFGPTETTDICTYYVVNRKFKNNESLPIGWPCNNCDILIVDEEGKECEAGSPGELYVRGDFVGAGYYNNPEKTNDAFVQNPINKSYPEIVYKTGDLGKINKYGEIEYLGRKDFQIKHMGYRIELGEIEANITALEGITTCACIYDENNKLIVLFYESSKLSVDDVIKYADQKLVKYMRPNKVIKVSKMPFNANGKIDRVKLKKDYLEMEG